MLPEPFRYAFLGVLNLTKVYGILLSVPQYFKLHQKCPPIASDICLIPAIVLTERIRRKEISCLTVIKAYIERIKAVNPILNALVEERFIEAIVEALNVDHMLSTTTLTVEELAEKYPLLGLPITVKESIATKGLSWTCGRYFANGRKATFDGEVVAKVKKAGGIVLLVSNVPELCLNSETYNTVTGATLNPYDTRRVPGGSSGGEAALISSGASIIGIGTDLFGSVRLPAHHCGIWGHKPTAKVVSINGQYPGTDQYDALEEVMTFGPMCRYSEDLRLSLKVMVKDDWRATLKLDEQVPLNELKVYYLDFKDTSMLSNPIDKDILLAMKKFCSYMKVKYECQVEKIQLQELKYALEVAIIPILNVVNVSEEVYREEHLLKLLVLYFLGKSNSVFPALLPNIMKPFLSAFTEHTKNYIIILDTVKEKLEALLGDNGILVFPCHPSEAPMHGQFAEKLIDYGYVGIFNFLGFPATSCPFGLNRNGLPIGIQIISRLYNDRLCLSVAEEIEREFGGWIAPKFL